MPRGAEAGRHIPQIVPQPQSGQDRGTLGDHRFLFGQNPIDKDHTGRFPITGDEGIDALRQVRDELSTEELLLPDEERIPEHGPISERNPLPENTPDGATLLENAALAGLDPRYAEAINKLRAQRGEPPLVDRIFEPVDDDAIIDEETILTEKDNITPPPIPEDAPYLLTEKDISPGPEIPEKLNDTDIITMEKADKRARIVEQERLEAQKATQEIEQLHRQIQEIESQKVNDKWNDDFTPFEWKAPLPIEQITNPSDLRGALQGKYPSIELQPDGTPTNKSKKDFDSIIKTDLSFGKQVKRYQEMQRNAGIHTPKPKSGIRRFFEKIGLAAGLIGATGAMGTSLENRNSDDTRAAQINAMSELDTHTQIDGGQIEFENLPGEAFDLNDPQTVEIIAGVAKTGRIERIKINPIVDAQVLSKDGVTYVRLFNIKTRQSSDGIFQGTHIVPDTSHTIQQEIHRLDMIALQDNLTGSRLQKNDINPTIETPGETPIDPLRIKIERPTGGHTSLNDSDLNSPTIPGVGPSEKEPQDRQDVFDTGIEDSNAFLEGRLKPTPTPETISKEMDKLKEKAVNSADIISKEKKLVER
jgi:hypothetical protein